VEMGLPYLKKLWMKPSPCPICTTWMSKLLWTCFVLVCFNILVVLEIIQTMMSERILMKRKNGGGV
jgi:hypothetical protein